LDGFCGQSNVFLCEIVELGRHWILPDSELRRIQHDQRIIRLTHLQEGSVLVAIQLIVLCILLLLALLAQDAVLALSSQLILRLYHHIELRGLVMRLLELVCEAVFHDAVGRAGCCEYFLLVAAEFLALMFIHHV